MLHYRRFKRFQRLLPPGTGLSVRLSIVRPLKIESAGVIFLSWGMALLAKEDGCLLRPRFFAGERQEAHGYFSCSTLQFGRRISKGLGARGAYSAEPGNPGLQFYPRHRTDGGHGRGHQIYRVQKPGGPGAGRQNFHKHPVFCPAVFCCFYGARLFFVQGSWLLF